MREAAGRPRTEGLLDGGPGSPPLSRRIGPYLGPEARFRLTLLTGLTLFRRYRLVLGARLGSLGR